MLGAALIVFREVIEAGLIVGIVLAAMRGASNRVPTVTLGVVGGVAGACVVAALAGRIGAAFEGAGAELFQAAVLATAVVMLAWHNAWMASHGREMARNLRTLGTAVSKGERPAVALTMVVGLAVLREGSEVVLFLGGVAASGGLTIGETAAGAGLGLVAGAAVSTLMYLGLLAIPAGRLLNVTSWMILLLAAGMASRAVAVLQQAGYADVLSAPLWDTSWLLPDASILGRAAQTLVGYTDQPNGLQLLTYLATALAIWALARFMATPRPPRAPMAAE